MTAVEPPTYPASEIEALIAALTGVLAARVVLDGTGRIDEIHVLADEELPPKRIVRNIESALGAGLAVTVDRRIISVAQLSGEGADGYRDDEDDSTAQSADTPGNGNQGVAPTPSPVLTAEPVRYVFVGYDARTQPDLEATCRVTIRRGNEVISGTGAGPCTPLGRAQAAARAVFAAIATARDDLVLGLEGVTVLESNGREHVLIAAHAEVGRQYLPLTGIALLQRSPEEAAILASLQATNRWAELDG